MKGNEEQKFWGAKEIFRKYGKTFSRIAGCISINARRILANQFDFFLNVVHCSMKIVFPASNLTQRNKGNSAGAIAVTGVQLMSDFMNNQVKTRSIKKNLVYPTSSKR